MATKAKRPGTNQDRTHSEEALAQLAKLEKGKASITVDGTEVKLTNLDKVLYPTAGYTKLDVARYYAGIAPVLIPHMRSRPLTLKRYPNGVDGQFFYQKRCPEHRPEWVQTHNVKEHGDRAEGLDYCMPDDVRTLLWAANLADLELHVLLSTKVDIMRPTVIAFDLDPGEGAGIVECCQVALLVRGLFADFGLECFPKTSGSKGVQVYVPLNDPDIRYEHTKPFSKAVAELLTVRHPELIVAKQLKELRRGKVLVDWSQNDDHKTTVCVYSLRARQRPTISTPLLWSEVEEAAAGADQDALKFEAADVFARVQEHGDLFEPVLTRQQELPSLG